VGPLELHEYTRFDAVGLSELIRAGEVTATEVESVAREAIAQADADLGALTLPMFDPALDHRTDGPLAGVPFVIKDSGPFAKGVPFTLGSRSIRGTGRRAIRGHSIGEPAGRAEDPPRSSPRGRFRWRTATTAPVRHGCLPRAAGSSA